MAVTNRHSNVPIAVAVVAVLLGGTFGCQEGVLAPFAETDAGDVDGRDDAVDTVDVETGDIAGDTTVDTRDGYVDTADADDSGDADPSRRGPPYPIVLAHGLGGFEHLADVKQLEYFYKIPELLRDEGEVVHVTTVDPFDDSYKRGHQLLQQVKQFTSDNNWDKVHIVGHSQGGLDARYVAHHRPDLVASVVTIATPHHGTKISDIATKTIEYSNTEKVIDALVEVLGRALYDKNGEKTRATEAIRQFSQPAIKEFNNRITNKPAVYYASIAGRSGSLVEQSDCESPKTPSFLNGWEYTVDPVDSTLRATESTLDGPTGTVPNDGLVRVEKAKWGEFLGCVPADHFDEVGQVLGDHPGGVNDWDYKSFYRSLADFLHQKE